MKRKNKSTRRWSKIYTLIAGVVILAVVGLVIYHFMEPKPSQTITLTQSKSQPVPSPVASHSSVATLPYQAPVINPTSNVPGGVTPSTSSVTLLAPEGTFVNNHGSGTDPQVTSNTEEVSNCTTTPGATCQIQFSQGSTTKSLTTQQTSTSTSKEGAAGTVSWSWTPASIGLTPGSWQITAVATLNGQTQSTQDTRQLVISQ